MNQDQLELALEQARKMERNGKFWTAVGAGMLVGGSILTFRGISGIPLGYGMVAWITGNERANMIDIELLAFNKGTLNLKPTEYGIGLALEF